MARYFMTGTKYEDFERMMMSTDRKGRDPVPQPKPAGFGCDAGEKKKE